MSKLINEAGNWVNVCDYNNQVECYDYTCDKCGWNPKVEAERIAKMRAARQKKAERIAEVNRKFDVKRRYE